MRWRRGRRARRRQRRPAALRHRARRAGGRAGEARRRDRRRASCAALMGYEGHVVGIADRAEREAKAAKAMDRLLRTARMVREAGLRCDIVSGGGTGTYDITGAHGGHHGDPGRLLRADGHRVRRARHPVRAGVQRPRHRAQPPAPGAVRRRQRPQVVLAGPRQPVREGHRRRVRALPQRRARHDRPPRRTARVAVGDRIELWPSHIDPTINLHDVMYACDGDDVVEVWPITARGYPERARPEAPHRDRAQVANSVRLSPSPSHPA